MIMIAYIVVKTFGDGSKEGVLFTDEQDAKSALNGTGSGSQLAVEFTDMYGGEPLQMIEVEI